MTNYEKIKSMSVEEMALYLSLPTCPFKSLHCMDNDCVNCFKKWLNQEAEE